MSKPPFWVLKLQVYDNLGLQIYDISSCYLRVFNASK